MSRILKRFAGGASVFVTVIIIVVVVGLAVGVEE